MECAGQVGCVGFSAGARKRDRGRGVSAADPTRAPLNSSGWLITYSASRKPASQVWHPVEPSNRSCRGGCWGKGEVRSISRWSGSCRSIAALGAVACGATQNHVALLR